MVFSLKAPFHYRGYFADPLPSSNSILGLRYLSYPGGDIKEAIRYRNLAYRQEVWAGDVNEEVAGL